MGKRIAILIGVSTYHNENDLPPCEQDIKLISSIISKSDKYDELLMLGNSPKSVEAKDKVSAFIRKYQTQEVDEAFIYYTGHGARHGDDFLYLFSDFDDSKVEQTALRNSEFDFMLKSLQPKLTVKVVDACQAGTEYIKSRNDLEVIFKNSSENSFNKTYFLFSSSDTESSIALQDYSVFTKSFARSLLDFEGKDIRYRDIMAFISDDPTVKKHQTPLFIQQADNTEVFCSVTPKLAEELSSKIICSSTSVIPEKSNSKVDENIIDVMTVEEKLIAAIREKSKNYCNEEQAQNSLTLLVSEIKNKVWSSPIADLFSITSESFDYITKLESNCKIAKWIDESEEQYFARITYKDEEYKVKEKVEIEEAQPKHISSIFGPKKRIEYKPVTKYRKVISSFEITAPAPIKSIIITLEPNEEILPWIKVFFKFVFSKSKLTLFFKHEIENATSWEHRSLDEKNEWRISHAHLKNSKDISTLVADAFTKIEKSVLEIIILDAGVD